MVSISGTAKQFVGPQIFRANTFGDDVCETIEGDEIHFPAPGDQVFYGAGMSASSPAVSAAGRNPVIFDPLLTRAVYDRLKLSALVGTTRRL